MNIYVCMYVCMHAWLNLCNLLVFIYYVNDCVGLYVLEIYVMYLHKYMDNNRTMNVKYVVYHINNYVGLYERTYCHYSCCPIQQGWISPVS